MKFYSSLLPFFGALCVLSRINHAETTPSSEIFYSIITYQVGDTIKTFYIDDKESYSIPHVYKKVMDIYVGKEYVHWLVNNDSGPVIVRSRKDGSEAEVIVTEGLSMPEKLAVDWTTGNIYFLDTGYQRIGVCNSDGSQCTTVVNGISNAVMSLVLCPQEGKLFWSEYNRQNPRIMTAGMDGKGVKPLVTENLKSPTGIALDYSTRRLYWGDENVIESISIDGSDRTEVLRFDSTPYAIAVFRNRIYWAEWQSESIQSADKFSGSDRKTVVQKINYSFNGFHVFAAELETKSSNPCKSQPCSQLCLLATDQAYSCACTLGHELNNDGYTCSTQRTQRILISAGKTMVEYYEPILGRPTMTAYETTERYTHVTYDPINRAILGGDQRSRSVFRFLTTNDELQYVMNINRKYIGDMDYDYYGNNVYWSDLYHRSIEIHSLETGEKTVLYFSEEPWDILLIPEHATMYVVFSSEGSYSIDKLPMNGIGQRKRIIENLEGPKISLAYDAELENIYWADQGSGLIESMAIDGTYRTKFRSGLQRPVSLAVLGGNIFWTEQESDQLAWADKRYINPSNNAAPLPVPSDSVVADLITIGGVYNGTHHECRNDNGGCSHVCLVDATEGHICSCPPGMVLGSNLRTCNWYQVCSPDQIRCSDDDTCINKMQRCDGKEDCQNGEDEHYCVCSANDV